jgi:hypothetical protein
MLRVLRMLKVMKYWKGLYRIFSCLLGAGQGLINIFVLLFVFMTMFALLGMQLFGGGCDPESRFHFDYYMPAMLTVLSIFSGGWVDPFNACTARSISVARIYNMLALVIGFFVIFNLFIAILLEAFASDDDEEEEDEAEDEDGGVGGKEDDGPSLVAAPRGGAAAPKLPLKAFCFQLATHPLWETVIIVAILVSSVALVLDEPRLDPHSSLKMWLNSANYFFTALFTVEMVTKMLAYDLLAQPDGYLLSAWNLLDLFIVTVSLVSLCPEMASLSALRLLRVLRPLRLLSRIEGMRVIFSFFTEAYADIFNVTAVVLFLQTVFAVLGMELFMGSFASCTDDSITLKSECVAHRALAQVEYPAPPQFARMPLLINATDESVGLALEVRYLAAAELAPDTPPAAPPKTLSASAAPLPAAVGEAALDEWTGAEATTVSEESAERRRAANARKRRSLAASSVGEVSTARPRGRRLKGGGGGGGNGIELPLGWLNPSFGSFDDFGSAMLILFIAATGDGWEDFMFTGMDSIGPGKAPERNDFSMVSMYFVAWLLVGTFTAINLFIGSVVDNFTRVKQKQDEDARVRAGGSALLTVEQKQWLAVMQEAKQNKEPAKRPKAPRTPMLKPIYELVTSDKFDIFITCVIVSNIGVMAIDFHHIEQYDGFFRFYTSALNLFQSIYYVECLLKLCGLGLGSYFRDPWNRFDFFLVATSLLDQFAADLMAKVFPVPPMMMRMLRVARIMRILRLLKGFKGLRDLLSTMILSFPAFMNVGGLLALVTFIYAVLGVQLFTYVMPGEELNEQRNFGSFGSSYLLLVQVLTGDNWSGLMYDSMVGPERGCDPDLVPTNCGNPLAIPYFLSYTIIGAFVLLNLVVAVILENFTALGNVNPDLVSATDIASFGEAWSHFDEDASGFITMADLAELLLTVSPPLGLGEEASLRQAKEVVATLGLPADEQDLVEFQSVVDALVAYSFKEKAVEAPPEIERELSERQSFSFRNSPEPGRSDHSGSPLPRSVLSASPDRSATPMPPPLPPPPPPIPSSTPPAARRASPTSGAMQLPVPVKLPAPGEPPPPPGRPPPLPGGWKAVSTSSGSTYYYSSQTRQVSWQPPIEWLRTPNRTPTRRKTGGRQGDTPSSGSTYSSRDPPTTHQTPIAGSRSATSAREPSSHSMRISERWYAGVPPSERESMRDSQASAVSDDGIRPPPPAHPNAPAASPVAAQPPAAAPPAAAPPAAALAAASVAASAPAPAMGTHTWDATHPDNL